MPTVSPFIAALPKTELHLHLVGSASPETVLDLSHRHPDAGLPQDAESLARFYTFRDFAHFIDVYIAVNSLVRTADDVRTLIVGAARDAAESNVSYVELTVTPVSHLLVGIDPYDLAASLTAAREEALDQYGVTMNWIFDIASEQGVEAAWQAVRFAVDHRPPGTVAFALAGPEVDWPRGIFRPHFEETRAAGLVSVVHAGETTGPETIWSAIKDLGAQRIGHGLSAATDPALLDYLEEHRITVEMCPTSNLRTRAVASIEEHPLPVLLTAGVPVTLSTDDPGMFGTHLNREYALVQQAFGLSDDELVGIARTGIDAALCAEETRALMHADLDAAATPGED
jgi:aminodeoxyfutalosine deaminase